MGAAENDHNEAKRLKDAGNIIPLAQILTTVSRERPGRILEVELRTQHDRLIYRVELVDMQGVVWYLHLDATWGTLLSTQKEKTP
jgi:uncharacterized membrane protein YkoI